MAAFEEELRANVKHGSLPLLYATIADAMAEGVAVDHDLKARFKRPRPFLVHDEIHPALPKPASDSFPGGHGTRGALVEAIIDTPAWAKAKVALAPEVAKIRASR